MSKRRVSNTRSRASRAVKGAIKGVTKNAEKAVVKSLEVERYLGLSIAGGKTDKTALCSLDYYPKQKKIFLSRLFNKIKSEGQVSADLKVCSLVAECTKPKVLAMDAPLQLPKCLRCTLKCPGYETCTVEEVQWMWKHHEQREKEKRPNKLFTPYTERCVDLYLATQLDEKIQIQHAMGSNMAPLTARALFLKRRMKVPVIEANPKVSLWRFGQKLHVAKSHLRFHKHWETGVETREHILQKMMDKKWIFIYEQDRKELIENANAFDSLLMAMTSLLYEHNQCEARPAGFPLEESWVAVPKVNFDLFD